MLDARQDAEATAWAKHRLRKAEGRRLAEAGCTSRQIASIPGHETLSEGERYTRDTEQNRLARAAILQLRGTVR